MSRRKNTAKVYPSWDDELLTTMSITDFANLRRGSDAEIVGRYTSFMRERGDDVAKCLLKHGDRPHPTRIQPVYMSAYRLLKSELVKRELYEQVREQTNQQRNEEQTHE